MGTFEKKRLRYILRLRKFSSPMGDYLIEKHGFSDLVFLDSATGIISKWDLFVELIISSVFVLKNVKLIRDTDIIFAIGYIAIPVKILSRLHIIRYRRLFSYGYFVHSPKWFPIFRWLGNLDLDNDRYIINSKSELELYDKQLHIDPKKMIFLPFGDWGSREVISDYQRLNLNAKKPYYFAGGYSNRDYVSLIKAFRRIPHKLIIVCSRLNSEINGIDLPHNVEIYKNIPLREFEEYIRQSRACILPLKYNSGASGQLVLLQYMRNRKIIIASAVNVIEGYIEHQASGLLINRIDEELPSIIQDIEKSYGSFVELGEAAYRQYKNKFTYEAISSQLSRVINEGEADRPDETACPDP